MKHFGKDRQRIGTAPDPGLLRLAVALEDRLDLWHCDVDTGKERREYVCEGCAEKGHSKKTETEPGDEVLEYL